LEGRGGAEGRRGVGRLGVRIGGCIGRTDGIHPCVSAPLRLCVSAPLRSPQLQLRRRLHDAIERERHAPHREPLGVGQGKRPPGGFPQLHVEHRRPERHRPRDVGVIGVGGLDPEPAGHEAAMPEPTAQTLAHDAQQMEQHAEIVGVGGQRVGQMEFELLLGGQHRPGVDPARPRPQGPAGAAEHGAQRGLRNGGDLADQLELVVVEPAPHAGMQIGQHVEGMGSEKSRLGAARDLEQRLGLDHRGGRLAHQLVDSHPDRQRQAEPLPRLPPDPLGDVDGGTEQPPGSGEIEEGVPVAARLDDRRVDPEDLVQRAGGPGVERRVGWQEDQVGAQLAGLPHRHPPAHPRPPGLGGQRKDDGAIGSRRRHHDGAGAERGRGQLLHRGAEGWGIDEEDGAGHVRDNSPFSVFIRYAASVYCRPGEPATDRRAGDRDRQDVQSQRH